MEFKSQDKIPLGDLIKSKIRELNWTQKELSERSGASEACISRVVNGSGLVKVENISSMLEILGFLCDKSRNVIDKAWSFSDKAKGTYSDLRHIVETANKAADKQKTSYLISALRDVADEIEGIKKSKKVVGR